MTQKIDPARLKAAAEHLEWVCQQYPNEERVQHVFRAMQPMIDDAKAGRILEPIPDRFKLPFRWAMSSEGLFRDFTDPDVEGAYVDFGIELEGGLSEQEKRILADMEAQREAIRGCPNFCVQGAGRLVHGGGRRLRRTTDAVGKSVPRL